MCLLERLHDPVTFEPPAPGKHIADVHPRGMPQPDRGVIREPHGGGWTVGREERLAAIRGQDQPLGHRGQPRMPEHVLPETPPGPLGTTRERLLEVAPLDLGRSVLHGADLKSLSRDPGARSSAVKRLVDPHADRRFARLL